MLFHNLKIRQHRSSMLVCHTCLHPSTQNTNLVGCRYTIGDQIQPLKSLKNISQHKRSQKSKVTLQHRKCWSVSVRKRDPRASVRPTAKGWCKSLLQSNYLPPLLSGKRWSPGSSRIPIYNQLLSSSLSSFLTFLCSASPNEFLGTQLAGYENWL